MWGGCSSFIKQLLYFDSDLQMFPFRGTNVEVHAMRFILGGQVNVLRVWCGGMPSKGWALHSGLVLVCGDALSLHHAYVQLALLKVQKQKEFGQCRSWCGQFLFIVYWRYRWKVIFLKCIDQPKNVVVFYKSMSFIFLPDSCTKSWGVDVRFGYWPE